MSFSLKVGNDNVFLVQGSNKKLQFASFVVSRPRDCLVDNLFQPPSVLE